MHDITNVGVAIPPNPLVLPAGSEGSPSAAESPSADSTTHHPPLPSDSTDTVVGLLEGYWVWVSIGVALAVIAVTTRIYTRPGKETIHRLV